MSCWQSCRYAAVGDQNCQQLVKAPPRQSAADSIAAVALVLTLKPLVLQAADGNEGGSSSAAPRGSDGRPMMDFYDEPTAPEDQEEEEAQQPVPQQQPLPSAAPR
jgi:hypothetical protein